MAGKVLVLGHKKCPDGVWGQFFLHAALSDRGIYRGINPASKAEDLISAIDALDGEEFSHIVFEDVSGSFRDFLNMFIFVCFHFQTF